MITHSSPTILGELPRGWGSFRLDTALSVAAAGDWGENAGEVSFPVLRSTNFTNGRAVRIDGAATRAFSQERAGRFDLRAGDILLERSGGGPTQPVGRVAVLEDDLPNYGFSNFVHLLRVDTAEMEPGFVAWCLFSLHQRGIIERLQHQTTQMRNLDLRDYLRLILPKPPRGEQQRIDAALSAVDRAIRRSHDELDACRTIRTALVQEFFERPRVLGLRNVRETKIGMLPASWDVQSCRALLAEPPSAGTSPTDTRVDPPGVPTLNVACIRDGRCTTGKQTYIDVGEEAMDRYRVRRGDFFVVRGNGNVDLVASGGLLTDEPVEATIYSDLLIRLRFNSATERGFVPWLWTSKAFVQRLQAKAKTGSGLWKIGQRDIKHHLVPVPPKPQQRSMVMVLDAAESAASEIRDRTVQLERLRRALLHDLLTGRVRLPEGEVS